MCNGYFNSNLYTQYCQIVSLSVHLLDIGLENVHVIVRGNEKVFIIFK